MKAIHVSAICLSLVFVSGCGRDCEEVEREASALLRQNQQCTRDDECTVVDLDASCIESLLCAVPVNGARNVDALRSEAQQLASEYRSTCPDCPQASCGVDANSPVHCDRESKRCAFR